MSKENKENKGISFELWMALRYMFSKKPRNKFVFIVTLFSVGSVFLGVSALIITLSLVNGFEHEVRSRMIETLSHITVYSFEKSGIKDWETLYNQILQADEKVVAAAPFVYTKTVLSSRNGNDGCMVRGIIPEYEEQVTASMENISSGTFFSNEWLGGQPVDSVWNDVIPPIVIGRMLASELGVLPGDTVIMYTLQNKKGAFGNISPKLKRFMVVGTFSSGLYDFDAALAYIPIEAAQKFFDLGERVSGFQVKIEDFYQADKVADDLEKEIGFPYYAQSWGEMNASLFAWMTLEKWGLTLVLMLIIAVAAFNIASTLIMVVLERTSEIGVLRAIGVSQKKIQRIFILQGLIVGLTGTILGGIFGLGICYLQNHFSIISLPAELYTVSALPMKVQILDIIMIMSSSIILSLLSSIYPAIRAAKQNPIDSIRFG